MGKSKPYTANLTVADLKRLIAHYPDDAAVVLCQYNYVRGWADRWEPTGIDEEAERLCVSVSDCDGKASFSENLEPDEDGVMFGKVVDVCVIEVN